MSLLGLMLLFNIGWGEIVLIVIVILLLFGGKKIPELMQGLGKGVRSFKKGLNEVEEELTTPDKNEKSDTNSTGTPNDKEQK